MDNSFSSSSQEQQAIFQSNKEQRSVYRIPALFYNRDENILMSFAEKRRTEDDAHAEALVMRKGNISKDETSDDKTIEWLELKPVEKAHIAGHRPMNPCPLYDKTKKTLFLFFICVEGEVSEQWQIDNSENKARLCYITTTDAGETWSDVTDLTKQLPKNWATCAVGPGHGLQTKSGRLIVPVHAYAPCGANKPHSYRSKDKAPYAVSLYSDDHGENWEFGSMFEPLSVECQMAEFFDDRGESVIYCNTRTEGGYRVEAVSGDTGKTFQTLESAKNLVETGRGCHGSVVSFPAESEDANAEKKEKWLLYTHPTNNSKRTDLGVYLNKSPDKPTKWSEPWIINTGPSGYSDLAYIDDGWFVCLFECGKKKETEQIASKVFRCNDFNQSKGAKEQYLLFFVSLIIIIMIIITAIVVGCWKW